MYKLSPLIYIQTEMVVQTDYLNFIIHVVYFYFIRILSSYLNFI